MSNSKKTSCTFMLAPMADKYVDVILGALSKLDTSRIEAKTERLGTVYSGTREDVVDALSACFIYAYRPELHMTMEATVRAERETLPTSPFPSANAAGTAGISFEADARFAVYGSDDAAEKAVQSAREMGIYVGSPLGCPTVRGDVHKLFAFVSEVLAMQDNNDFTLELTFSVNSPTAA